MASWAWMLRKPSDLGYPSAGYDLPPLHYHQHVVGVEYAPSIETGLLFPMQAATLAERIGARRETVEDRVRMAVEVTPSRSEEHTSELQSLMRISYAVFCLKKKNNHNEISKN